MDETAFRRRHDYGIVSDQDNGTVLYVGKDRKKVDLERWFEALPRSCLEAIESVSMDMWPAFINGWKWYPGLRAIAFDKKGEAQSAPTQEAEKAGKADLKGTKYDWLSHRT